MRIGVVVDATCDLPQAFLKENRIGVLPIALRLGDQLLSDERDPAATLRFYREQLAEKGMDAETIPLSAEQIKDRFLDGIVLDYDHAFVITVTATRSPIFENATKACFAILNGWRAVRAKHSLAGQFSMRVIDSQSMFSGTAVLAVEAIKLIRAGQQTNEIRKRLETLRTQLVALMVPYDLYYIRNRGNKKGENSVGLLSYGIGTMLDIKPVLRAHRGQTEPVAKIRHFEKAVERMFDYVAFQVEQGVEARQVCISYGGDPAKVAAMPGYAGLAKTAAEKGVEVHVAIMSATAAVNAGGGGVSIAFAGEQRPFRW